MNKLSLKKLTLIQRQIFACSRLSAITRGLGITAVILIPIKMVNADIIVNGVSQGNGDYTQSSNLIGGPGFAVEVTDPSGTFTIDPGISLTGSGSSTFRMAAGSSLSGLVVNGILGTVPNSGFNALNMDASSTIDILNIGSGGLIETDRNGNATIAGLGTITTLNNAGTIENTGSSTALILNNATSITNEVGGLIRGASGHAVLFGFNGLANIGTFINNGNIATSTTASAAIGFGSNGITTVNSFINTGNIESSFDAIRVSVAGSSVGFTNSGTITAAQHGLLVNNGTELTSFDNTGGTITSTGTGGAALYLREDQDITIINTGILRNTSSGNGLWIDTESQSMDFSNSGTISSATGTAINADSAMTGATNGFINTGIITGGGGTAIDAEADFKLTNSGTITGDINHATTGVLTIVQSAGSIEGDIVSTADSSHSISLNGGSVTGDITLDGATANNLILNGATVSGNINIGTGAVDVRDSFTTGGTITATTVNVAENKTLNLGHNITATTYNAGTVSIEEGSTRTIAGDYTQTSSGILQIGAASNSNYGKLKVTGTAAMGNDAKIDVDVNSINSLAKGQTLTSVLSAANITGNNSYTVTDNSALFNFIGATNGNAVDLTIEKGTTVLEAVTNTGLKPGRGAATVFDDLIDNGGGDTGMSNVITELGQLSTDKEVSDAVESTLPGITGGVAQLTNFTTNAVTNVVGSRQDLTRGLSSGDGFVTNKHFWFKPFGGWTEQDDRQGITGYDIDSYGLALGMDGDITSSWNLGAALAYINSDVDSNLTSGSHNIDMDSYIAKIYATHMLDDVTALNLQLGAGISDYDSNRRIFTGDVASADYDSWHAQASVELERSFSMSDKTVLTPYVHADYTYVDVESYDENGAGALNLNVNSDSDDSLVIGAGIKANQSVSENLLLLANAGIGYDLMTDRTNLTSSFAGGGANFTTEGMKPDEWVYNAGVGMKYNLENGTEITTSYDVSSRQDYTYQSISANVRFMF